jgi:hypothetical protein
MFINDHHRKKKKESNMMEVTRMLPLLLFVAVLAACSVPQQAHANQWVYAVKFNATDSACSDATHLQVIRSGVCNSFDSSTSFRFTCNTESGVGASALQYESWSSSTACSGSATQDNQMTGGPTACSYDADDDVMGYYTCTRPSWSGVTPSLTQYGSSANCDAALNGGQVDLFEVRVWPKNGSCWLDGDNLFVRWSCASNGVYSKHEGCNGDCSSCTHYQTLTTGACATDGGNYFEHSCLDFSQLPTPTPSAASPRLVVSSGAALLLIAAVAAMFL